MLARGRKRSLTQALLQHAPQQASHGHAGNGGGVPPLRGATSSRTQALATFYGLVADGAPAPAAANRDDQQRPPSPQRARLAPAAAPKSLGGAAPAAAPSPAAALEQQPATAAPTTKASPAQAAQQLQTLINVLRRCSQKIACRGSGFLYQHHEEIACAQKQLRAAMAALPVVLEGPGSDDSLLAALQQGSTECWVSGAGGCMRV